MLGGVAENSQLFRLVGGICRLVKLVPLVRCPGKYKKTFSEVSGGGLFVVTQWGLS